MFDATRSRAYSSLLSFSYSSSASCFSLIDVFLGHLSYAVLATAQSVDRCVYSGWNRSGNEWVVWYADRNLVVDSSNLFEGGWNSPYLPSEPIDLQTLDRSSWL